MFNSTRVEFCSCFGVLHDLKMALQNDSATVWTSSLDSDETDLLHLQLRLREEALGFQDLGTLEINSTVTVQNH